jgi:ABC-type ATPase involved in cell division
VIDSLTLENFKCFEKLRLETAPLTLLTGFNAAGKSTTLQTLLLLCQTIRGQRGISELRMNGPLVALGTPGDLIRNNGDGNRVALGIATADAELLWHFAVPEDNRRSLRVVQLEARTEEGGRIITAPDLDGIRPLVPEKPVQRAIDLLGSVVYLSAARQVETEVFPVPQEMDGSTGDVGPIGQFAAWWLHQEGDSKVALDRCCKSAPSTSTLRHQVNAWASNLFPNAEINAVPLLRTSLMRLELRSGPTSDWSRPANVGYGISYAFPILVAGLCVCSGQPVIVDSPEAHLHPRAQSGIGGFLAQMAAAGTQILVESHSDHVLNGIRIAVREGVIDPAKVAIYFFASRPDAQVTRLALDRNGTVSNWPEGFFDQSEKDLANLAGWA